jgi:hypothetical protein
MTLTGSGQISFNDLRVELGVSSQAPFSITSAATGVYATINTNSPSYPNSSTPHQISEWYSYNHNAATCYTLTGFEISGITSLVECFTGLHSTSVYSTCATLSNGCVVYQTSGCTNPYYTFIQGGDGTNYELNGSGVVIGENNPNC